MPYIPHTDADREAMLRTIGVSSIDDLFCEIPEDLKFKRDLNVPAGLDEHKLFLKMTHLARQNQDATKLDWYLGAGLYDRYIPATVGPLITRGEFLTAYTPYQPEFSQGYLQTIYEFQSMVAELYGCDLANASMYDAATAMAEAALMACGINGRTRVVVSDAVHPHYREVLNTYCWASSVTVDLAASNQGMSVFDHLDGAACLIVQNPNFFGSVEDLAEVRRKATEAGALMIVVADPVACALLKPPGAYDADIVVGEGQPMGVAMGFGGPLVGLFACKKEYVRRIPGRIVGRTHDADGRPGFVMTLRTREQDIRREKATSNICTNEALMALAATITMAALGKNGLRSVAESSVRNTHYARQKLVEAGGRLKYPNARVFGEFVLELSKDAGAVRDALIDRGIMAGLPLGPYYPGLENCLLVAVTETRTKEQIDRFAQELKEVLR